MLIALNLPLAGMNKTNTDIRHYIRVAAIITICAVVGFIYMRIARVVFDNTANKHWKNRRYTARIQNPANRQLVDSCAQLLKTGDLVVRRGDDMTSYMLSKLNLQDKTYSHCGIVVIEEGQPVVYHCIGGEDNPDEKMKRETVQQWFSPANNHAFAVYRYNIGDSVVQKVVKQVHLYYKQNIMFDMDFDLKTDDRFYCSEMVYKCLSAATSNPQYVPVQHSYGRNIIGVDNLYLNGHATQICQARFK